MKTNKHFFTVTIIALTMGLLISPAFGASKNMQTNQGIIGVQTGTSSVVANLPYEELSAEEELGIIRMREEEKMARDVYASLYELWQAAIFNNISQSEQRHMNAVKVLIDKYDIIDPVVDPTVGVFTDNEFQGLYESFVEQGTLSLIDALKAGATIEEIDISDLQSLISQTDNLDIKTVYQNLLKGSRNHLRAFAYQLSLNGETYEAQSLTEEELEAILTSPRETGRVDENGVPLSTPKNSGSAAGGRAGTVTCTGVCVNN